MKKQLLCLLAMGAIVPLASSCGNPATKLESGDPVFTRQAYIDLSDVPAKVSVNATVEGEITRAMLGSRIVVSTDKLGYRDGVLTLDTSVLYDDAGELAISSGEQTLRLYTSNGTVDIEILLVNKVLRTAEDILDLNDYIENPDAMAGSYILGNDIDLSGVANFEPLGYSDSVDGTHYQDTFNGVFDGNGFTISGITSRWNGDLSTNKNVYDGNPLWTDVSHSSGDNWGFFQEIGEAGIVRNVKFSDCSFAGRTIVGTVAGLVSGKIENVLIDQSCDVTASTHFYDESCNAAGIAGIVGASGSVSNCVNLSTSVSVLDMYTDYGDDYIDSDGVNYHVFYSGDKGMTDSNGTISTGVYGGVGLVYGSATDSYSALGNGVSNFGQTHLEANKEIDGPDSGTMVGCGAYSLSSANGSLSLRSSSLYESFDQSVWNISDGSLPSLAASFPYINY